MKIGINALFMIPGEVGGTETYLRKILAELPKLAPEHELVIFANEENRNLFARELAEFSNVSIIDTKVKATSRLKRIMHEQFVLPKVVAAQNLDVLWNPGNVCPLLKHVCPYVTTIHDMQYVSHPEDFTKAGLFFMKTFTPKAIAKSDAIITISEFSRQEIVKHSKVKVDRVHVVLSAVSQNYKEQFDLDFIKERKLALLHSSDPYLLVIANSYPHKSIETAVEAFGKLNSLGTMNLVILGRPRLGEAAVQSAIDSLPESCRERVIRLHYVVESDLRALYQGAAAFVFPSKYEGFGLPVLEALAVGTPVACSEAPALKEVTNGAAIYFDTNNPDSISQALVNITLDESIRAQLQADGLKRASEYSWDKVAKATFELYKTALGK